MSRIRCDRILGENTDILGWESPSINGWILSEDAPDNRKASSHKPAHIVAPTAGYKKRMP